MRSHLESIPIELKTLSPLHIGCGKSITKKEYIYLENGQRVLIPDINKLFNYLVKNNFVKDFENYMLGAQQDLYKWLTGLNITKEEIESIKSYEVNASDAIIPQKPLKEINLIIKDNYKKPYIPGSSLKGYIKTAMLSKFISEDKKFAQYMFTKLKRKVENRNHNFKDEEREMDSYFLNKISTGEIKGKNSSVNSLMKGIQISDSEPIEVENVILCAKIDYKNDKTKNTINTLRECIKPHTKIRHVLTVDKNIFKNCGIDIEFIKESIKNFYNIQKTYYKNKFLIDSDTFKDYSDEEYEIFLGGGAGYHSKTLSYSLGGDDALNFVSMVMHKKFSKHGHKKDVDLGVSPHTLKCTKYNNKHYIMGRCSISFANM